MSDAPQYEIDVHAFWQDPYPDLLAMPAIAFVPQLGATLINGRNDIATCEKNVSVFSSYQPNGLMSLLMGENMMRKDGEKHMLERRANYPCFSPGTVKQVWRSQFQQLTENRLRLLRSRNEADLFWDYAMHVSADALRCITGLTNLTSDRMNAVSQGMIDANRRMVAGEVPGIDNWAHAGGFAGGYVITYAFSRSSGEGEGLGTYVLAAGCILLTLLSFALQFLAAISI